MKRLSEDYTSQAIRRAEIEQEQGWMEDRKLIPYLRFPSHWAVQIIPPFGNACIRFKVQVGDNPHEKSVYFDTRGALGWWGNNGDDPYWEVYPYQGDVGRCDPMDVEKLFEMIEDNSEGEKE